MYQNRAAVDQGGPTAPGFRGGRPPALYRGTDRYLPRHRNLSVGAALDRYCREHVGERVIDRGRQEIAIRHLCRLLGEESVEAIDVGASRAYRDARRAEGVADGTIRRELGVLIAAAEHCVRWKHLDRAHMPSVELPLVAKREAPWLREGEIGVVIGEATGRLRDFIMLAYYTAGRRGSVERLRKCQVDIEQRRINLRAPDESVLRQNSKKHRPIVPVTVEMLPVVERLIAEPGEWLLGSPTPMYKAFRSHLSKLGFADRANPHILRHSRATHLLQKGVSIWNVAKLLGDTVRTVERAYGHHCPDQLREAI